jgi:mRNA interferase RelE/StbE
MASYRIEWRSSARRELRRLPPRAIARVVDAVAGLADDPRPTGCRKLQGSERTFRVRVGQYRVVYEVRDDRLVVLIVRVRHRRDVYR